MSLIIYDSDSTLTQDEADARYALKSALASVAVDKSADLLLTSTTQSTGVGSGALQTAGGASIAKNLNIGGTLTTATVASTAAACALGVYGANYGWYSGGVSMSASINGSAKMTIASGSVTWPSAVDIISQNLTQATTTSDGAVKLSGGLSSAKSVVAANLAAGAGNTGYRLYATEGVAGISSSLGLVNSTATGSIRIDMSSDVDTYISMNSTNTGTTGYFISGIHGALGTYRIGYNVANVQSSQLINGITLSKTGLLTVLNSLRGPNNSSVPQDDLINDEVYYKTSTLGITGMTSASYKLHCRRANNYIDCTIQFNSGTCTALATSIVVTSAIPTGYLPLTIVKSQLAVYTTVGGKIVCDCTIDQATGNITISRTSGSWTGGEQILESYLHFAYHG